jgi:hypothetical protein
MGMPFPLGLRSLDGGSREKIAWAWSINGFLSVVATPLALILAVEAGAFWVLGFAALVYAVAFLVVGLWRANR